MALALGRFAQLGARAAVIKQGIRGSWVMADGQAWQLPALPIAAVDPTGAGDAYCGGFIAGLIGGQPLAVCAAMGTVAASYVVEACGALATPRPLAADRNARVEKILSRIRTPDG